MPSQFLTKLSIFNSSTPSCFEIHRDYRSRILCVSLDPAILIWFYSFSSFCSMFLHVYDILSVLGLCSIRSLLPVEAFTVHMVPVLSWSWWRGFYGSVTLVSIWILDLVVHYPFSPLNFSFQFCLPIFVLLLQAQLFPSVCFCCCE